MLKLNIFADASMIDVREVREVPRMKIPYRTSEAVVDMLADTDLENMNNTALLGMIIKNRKHLTAVVQATFGLTDDDLDHIDTMELLDLGKEIVKWVLDEIAKLGADKKTEGGDPNGQTLATAAR
jgi:hypothetical protein